MVPEQKNLDQLENDFSITIFLHRCDFGGGGGGGGGDGGGGDRSQTDQMSLHFQIRAKGIGSIKCSGYVITENGGRTCCRLNLSQPFIGDYVLLFKDHNKVSYPLVKLTY